VTVSPRHAEPIAPHVLTAANPGVLSAHTDAAILSALHQCESKVLYRDTQGRHRELHLSRGLQRAAVRGTYCFMNLEAAVPTLTRSLAPPALDPAQVERVNLYVSPPRAGAPLHFDIHTVIIVQLSGRKLWQVAGTPAADQPTRNVVADEIGTLDLPAEMHFALLHPGDWLLVPRGTWHGTFSHRGSVSASLALRGADGALVESLCRSAAVRVPPRGRYLPC